MKWLAIVFCLFVGIIVNAQQLGDFKPLYSLERSTITKLDPITNQSNEINVIDLVALGVDENEGDLTIFQLRSVSELDQLVAVLEEANGLIGQKKNKEWRLTFLKGYPSMVSIEKKSNKIRIKTVYEVTLDGESNLECFFNVEEITKLIQLLQENKNLLK